ncbi:MAG: ankyrin repeat domain-containing protein [Chlamydiae bacterium]|nr:ankyrin repeat domain-containing protein [Chlamydiota bacterium]
MTNYVDIVFLSNNYNFYIKNSSTKPQLSGSALTTLKNIQKVFEKGLVYVPQDQDDWYSKLSKDKFGQELYKISDSIHENYNRKVERIGWICRKLKGIDKEKEKVEKVVKEIHNQICPPIESLHKKLDDLLVTKNDVNNKEVTDFQLKVLDWECKYLRHTMFERPLNVGDIIVYYPDPPKFKPKALTEIIENSTPQQLLDIFCYSFLTFPLITEEILRCKKMDDFKTLLEALIKDGADINKKNPVELPPLAIALKGNKKELIFFLLEKGADLTVAYHLDPPKLISKRPNDNTYLIDAVLTKDIKIVQKILQRPDGKKQINEPGIYGYTPLHEACRWEREDIVKLLLDYGADYSIKNQLKVTPLDVAIICGNLNIVKLLCKNDWFTSRIFNYFLTYNVLLFNKLFFANKISFARY